MSRAFAKETDGALDPLPDLPMSSLPNYMIPRGFSNWQMRLRSAIVAHSATQPLIEVAFGPLVTSVDQNHRTNSWQIVGEALTGTRVGDKIWWPRPFES